jgi:hypothetical protein
LVKAKIAKNGARVVAVPGIYTQPPYGSLLSVSTNQSSSGVVPLYWNDPLRSCQICFRCTANFTTGWKDNTSFQLSTTSTNNKTWSWIYGREIKVKPSEHYQLVTHMKINEFAAQSHIQIEGYNETSKKWYQITQCPSGTDRLLEWHEFRCNLTIPQDTTKVRPILDAGLSSQPDKEAVTWFDDINLSNLNNVHSNKTYTTTNLISNPDFVHYSDLKQLQQSDDPTTTTIMKLKLPTDDSPFYFAREQIPHQMIILLETVLGISAILALLLIYYSRLNGIQLSMLALSSRFHILFAGLIGLGFIFLEITFIQKFLLLLGTPIMALTVVLFSILLSTGIGAYLSGRLFSKNPFKAVVVSIPILAGILIAYYNLLPGIIYSEIVLPLQQRIALTFAILSPTGLLMGFQFPSITRMAYSFMDSSARRSSGDVNVTLLWGVNVIASVIGTVLTAISSIVIGFSNNLLIGLGLYLAGLASAIAAVKITQQVGSGK